MKRIEIWCDTNDLRDRGLETLEKQKINWQKGEKATKFKHMWSAPLCLVIENNEITMGCTKSLYPNAISAEEYLQKNQCIVIYRKDDKVIALDESTGEKAVARCHPEDKFDFETGAKLAFMRLVDPCFEEIPFIVKPKLLNTKICITKSGGHLTTGRIYEIKDGKFKDDIGNEFPIDEPISDITSLKKYFTFGGHAHFCGSDVEFVEVVE